MMENAYLVSYSVKGIKNIDTLVTLSFYKKTIEKDLDVQNYNIKGIYGVNGSRKIRYHYVNGNIEKLDL